MLSDGTRLAAPPLPAAVAAAVSVSANVLLAPTSAPPLLDADAAARARGIATAQVPARHGADRLFVKWRR